MAASRTRVALFKSLGALLERLPERVDVTVASSVARPLAARAEGVEANVRDNLAHALAGGLLDAGDVDGALLDLFVERSFQSYGRYWAEGAKLPALSPSTIAERFTIAEGMEYLEAARDAGKGTVVAIPHVGSWEWGGAYLDHLGMSMTAVAEALDPPELFEWFKKKRESIGIRVEPLDEHAGTVLLRTLRAGGVVGLLCDRDLQANGIEVEFFGERVTMPAGPATLALRTGAALICAGCYSGPGRDHYAVVSAPIDATREGRLRDDVARVTQAITRVLEGLIRRAPEQWHVLERRFAPS